VNVTTEERSGVKVAALEGALGVAAALELRDLLDGLLEGPGAKVLLDLGAVTLIDSSGVGILVTAHRLADSRGAAFALAAAPGPVGRVFELTRTDKLLRIYATVEDGLAALAA
jgi:anti-sigma B factor antagonist